MGAVEVKITGSDESKAAFASLKQSLSDVGTQAGEAAAMMTEKLNVAFDAVKGLAEGAFNFIKKNILEVDTSFEQSQLAIRGVFGPENQAAADQFFNDMINHASKMSFNLEAVQADAQKMLAEGFDAKQVLPTLDSINAALTAVGRTSNANLDQVVNVFTKMEAGGVATRGELNSLTKAGIDAFHILPQQMGISIDQLNAKLKAGTLDSETVIKALTDGMTARYKDAAANAQDSMALMTTNVTDNLQKLADTAGKPIFDAMKGGMKDLLDATNNLLSSGALDGIGKAIGDGIAGAIDFVAHTAIPDFVAAWNTIAPVVGTVADVVTNLAGIFVGIAQDAFGWGANIIGALADGIASGVGDVTSALGAVGDTITGLLEAHSPPKLLPELTNWGRESMKSWLSGWTSVDFGILNGVVDPIKNLLDSMSKTGQIAATAVGPDLQAVTDQMTALIDQFDKTGQIAPGALDAIVRAAGPAGESVRGLVQAEIDVAEKTKDVTQAQQAYDAATAAVTDAQQALNDVTQHYADILGPMNDALNGIKEQEDAINAAEEHRKNQLDIANAANDAKLQGLELQKAQLQMQTDAADAQAKEAQLYGIINDSKKSQEEKDKAKAELDQLNIDRQIKQIQDQEKVADLQSQIGDSSKSQLATLKEQQMTQEAKIKGVQTERDQAERAAKDKLDAAKKEQDAAKENLTAQQTALKAAQDRLKTEQDVVAQLVKQNDLIANQQKALQQAAGGGHGGGGGRKPSGGGAPQHKQDLSYGSPVEWHEPEMAATSVTKSSTAIDQAMAKIKQAVQGVEVFLSPVFTALNGFVKEFAHSVSEVLGHAIDVGAQAFQNIEPALTTARDLFASIFNAWTTILPGVVAEFNGFIDVAGAVISNVGAYFAPIFKGIGDAITAVAPHVRDFMTALGGFLSVVGQIVGKLQPVAAFMGGVLGEAFRILGTIGGWVLDQLTGFVNFITGQLKSALNGTNPVVNTLAAVFQTAFGIISTVVSNVVNFFVSNWPLISSVIEAAWNNVISPVLGFIGGAIGTLIGIVGNIVGFVVDHWPEISAAIKSAWDNVISPALTALGNFITGTVLPVIQNIVNWVTQHWPDVANAVKSAWDNFISPALKSLNDFITNTVLPTIQNIVNWITQHWPDVANAIKGAWDNFISPALTGISDFITKTVLPAIQNLVGWVQGNFHFLGDVIQGVIDTINGILGPFKATIDGISSAIDTLLGKKAGVENLNSMAAGAAGAINSRLGVGNQSGDVKSYDVGGWVSAPKGQPQLAIVHGGEYVVPADVFESAGRGGGSSVGGLPFLPAPQSATLHVTGIFKIDGHEFQTALSPIVISIVDGQFQAAVHEANV